MRFSTVDSASPELCPRSSTPLSPAQHKTISSHSIRPLGLIDKCRREEFGLTLAKESQNRVNKVGFL
ncbi:hypothetical protein PFLUV_G00155150 [Perca fluviatilis]|uniref:Uncharacterized protein n=1 Tax=Perca fluviatilis TaxID=8168 RepID=A0A6A5EKR2_PERFL|nr:hypothetical protein PFLUV_G00155150 [Perca fluviatilis]